MAKFLVTHKATDINRQNKTKQNALHCAIEQRNVNIVKLLAKHGIDLRQENEDGRNALHLASFNGDKDVVEYLLTLKRHRR